MVLLHFVYTRKSIGDILVHHISHRAASEETTEDGQWKGARREAEPNTANIHDGLQPFTEHRDEGQDEHDVFLTPMLQPADPGGTLLLLLEGPRKLDTPFLAHLVDAQQPRTHDRDDDRGDESKDTFPDIFRVGEGVLLETVKSTDHAGADAETEEETDKNTPQDLNNYQLQGQPREGKWAAGGTCIRKRLREARCPSAPRVWVRKASSTETMMLLSRHSRKQMKKTTAVRGVDK